MAAATCSDVTLGRRVPRRSLRRRRVEGEAARWGARARVSQAAGVQAEEKIDMIITPEISTSGTGVTETRGMILVNGGVIDKGDAAQKNQYDIVDAGPNYILERVHQVCTGTGA
eukprot:5528259-Pyramimonas_sp.AAC.1